MRSLVTFGLALCFLAKVSYGSYGGLHKAVAPKATDNAIDLLERYLAGSGGDDPCTCTPTQCECCTTISLKGGYEVCGTIDFVPDSTDIDFKLSIDERERLNQRISLADPPTLRVWGRLFMEFTDVSATEQSACVRLNAGRKKIPLFCF